MRYFIQVFSLSSFFFFVSLFTTSSVFAAFSLNISNINPDNVSDSEQEVSVTISLTDLPSESYFRVGWQESSGKPYFGFIKNDNESWVKVESSQDCKSYYKVSDLTKQSITIITKIGQDNTPTNGSYLLKARDILRLARLKQTVNLSLSNSIFLLPLRLRLIFPPPHVPLLLRKNRLRPKCQPLLRRQPPPNLRQQHQRQLSLNLPD